MNDLALLGQILDDKFRVERIVGRGGMGVVLAAEHLQLHHRVAIKLLHPESNDAAVQRFMREARAAVRIQSEHVSRVLDAGQLDSGELYLVMELLEGEDLSTVVKRWGPLAVPDVVLYVLQACEALAQAHELGIVHRDIKPANLFLTQRADGSPCIKVLDFGISKVQPVDPAAEAEPLTESGAIFGSPHYMSPEQLRSTGDVDRRTDIWALGVVMHKLLTATAAFEAGTMAELCVCILQDPPAPLRTLRPDVPPELEAAVNRCLAKDPTERFQNIAELAYALEPLCPVDATTYVERIGRIVDDSPAQRIPSGPVETAATVSAANQTGQTAVTPQAGTLTNAPAELTNQVPESKRRRRWWLSLSIAGLVATVAAVVALLILKPEGPAMNPAVWRATKTKYLKLLQNTGPSLLGRAAEVGAQFRQRLGKSVSVLKLWIGPREAVLDARDPKNPDQLYQYRLRNTGQWMKPSPLRVSPQGRKELPAKLFDLDEIDFTAIPKILEDALERAAITNGSVQHLRIEKVWEYDPPVRVTCLVVTIETGQELAIVYYDSAGSFVRLKK